MSLVFEVLNKRKQNTINSFQIAPSRILIQVVDGESNIPLATVPSRKAEKPPKAASLASENTTVEESRGGTIEKPLKD